MTGMPIEVSLIVGELGQSPVARNYFEMPGEFRKCGRIELRLLFQTGCCLRRFRDGLVQVLVAHTLKVELDARDAGRFRLRIFAARLAALDKGTGSC